MKFFKPFKLLSLLALGVMLMGANAAHAANVRWLNPVSGNFNDPTNWNTGTVPGPGDTAIIQVAGTYVVTLNAPAQIKNFLIGRPSGGDTQQLLITGGNTLTLESGGSGINVTGQVTLADGTLTSLAAATAVDVNGGLLLWTGGTMSGAGSTGANAGGEIRIEGAAAKTLSQRSLNTSGGTINWNAGTITVANGARVENRGTFNSFNGATFAAGAGAPFVFTNSLGGQLNPGTNGAVGVLNIGGSFVQLDASTLNVDVTAANYDQINITGTATLAGTLNVTGAATIQDSDSNINILTYASRSGEFTTVNPSTVTVVYDPNVARLVTNVVFINRIFPSPAQVGQSITISGRNFANTDYIEFTDKNGNVVNQTSFQVLNDPGRTDGSKIQTTVPEGLASGGATVRVHTTDKGFSNSKRLQIAPSGGAPI